MSYDAKVFHVMIASPGDVVQEREIVQKCIHTWNASNSEFRRIVLLPLRWESHSSPEMGDHPQTIINKQVLEKADLLVGIFWKRIGTKTKDFPSGTVEEIETHAASGKPAMVYFSNISDSSIEPDPEQNTAVQDYRIDLKSRGLYNGYKTLTEFKDQFTEHLAQKLNYHPLFSGTSSEDLPKPAPVGNIERIYILAANIGSELRSFREISGERLFRITEKYGLRRYGDNVDTLAVEVATLFEKERHQWFDELTKGYMNRFGSSLKKLIELISNEAKQTPAFSGYEDCLKKIPKGLEDILTTIGCLTEVSKLAEGYVVNK